MDNTELQKMATFEDEHWWFKSLREIVISQLRSSSLNPQRILDAGCGSGGMLLQLNKNFPNAELHGIDISETACDWAKSKSNASILRGSVESLPYPNNFFQAVVCLDVLEYDVSASIVLGELTRVLASDGILIINVPAYAWLYSYHDIAVGQVRRFNKTELNRLYESSSVIIRFQSYWNSLLLPFMIIKRKLFKHQAESDVSELPNWLNNIIYKLLGFDRICIRNGIPLKFGGSILTTLKRQSND
jgi:ubiquinone/menaquinone biosynthesis C-methylase UbiE